MKYLVLLASVTALLAASTSDAEAHKRKGKRSGFTAGFSSGFSCKRCLDQSFERQRFAFRAVSTGRRVQFADVFYHKVRLEGGQ